jgi:GGDEF domain-containing protein
VTNRSFVFLDLDDLFIFCRYHRLKPSCVLGDFMPEEYRSDDAVITVCQSHRTNAIDISDVTSMAAELLGYGAGELASQSLYSILPPRIADLLREYMNSHDGAHDVGAALAKAPNFSVIGKDGKERTYRLKVVRSGSGGGASHFKLILQDKMGRHGSETLRNVIMADCKRHEVLDHDFGLPNRHSLSKDIELMSSHNGKNSPFLSCFVIVQIDHYDELFSQYGRPDSIALTKDVALVCRQNLRPGDVVGIVSYKRVGVLACCSWIRRLNRHAWFPTASAG